MLIWSSEPCACSTRVVRDPGSHLQLQPTDVGIATLGNRPAIHTSGVGGIGPGGYG